MDLRIQVDIVIAFSLVLHIGQYFYSKLGATRLFHNKETVMTMAWLTFLQCPMVGIMLDAAQERPNLVPLY